MKQDLITYRLNSWNELLPYLRENEVSDFMEFVNKAYSILIALKPGERFIIEDEVHPDNREKFIKVCCMFITENHTDYEITNDYSGISRLEADPKVEIQEILDSITFKRKRKYEMDGSSGGNNRKARAGQIHRRYS